MALEAPEAGRQALDALAKPEDVVGNRNGDVLIKHTLLKADHFPGKRDQYAASMWQRSAMLSRSLGDTLVRYMPRWPLTPHKPKRQAMQQR